MSISVSADRTAHAISKYCIPIPRCHLSLELTLLRCRRQCSHDLPDGTPGIGVFWSLSLAQMDRRIRQKQLAFLSLKELNNAERKLGRSSPKAGKRKSRGFSAINMSHNRPDIMLRYITFMRVDWKYQRVGVLITQKRNSGLPQNYFKAAQSTGEFRVRISTNIHYTRLRKDNVTQ